MRTDGECKGRSGPVNESLRFVRPGRGPDTSGYDGTMPPPSPPPAPPPPPAPSSGGVLAAGLFIVDAVKTIDRWPEQDALALVQSRTLSNGGGAYNVLKNIARLDPSIPRLAAGRIGDDDLGDWIRSDCDAAGIDRSRLVSGPAGTSYTDVMSVRSTGRRTFFHFAGENAHFDGVPDGLGGVAADTFYLGYVGLLPKLDRLDGESTGASRLLDAARAAGLRAVVDCVSVDRPDFAEIAVPSLRAADLFLCNEFEASRILGQPVHNGGLPIAHAAEALQQVGGGIVALHTPDGAVATDGDETAFRASVRMSDDAVEGTNGAGDAFAAGFLIALRRGQPLDECLLLGVCAAAMSLTDPTPSGGLRTTDECLALGERNGFRA